MSGWSPSYKDCDNIISDIYALTQTARMRRRGDVGLEKLRICEEPRPSPVSSIQSRPLPTPGAFSRQPEHIYQSPVRSPLYSRRPPQYPARQQNYHQPGPARYQQNSRIPLAISQQSISQQRAPVSQVTSRPAAPRTNLATRDNRRLSSHVGLGARAVTELDFSRSRPVVNHCPVINTVKSPSLTDSSEHGSSLLGSDTCLRKGVMWVQQEKLFSRWKERFIILTSSYLHIFKKSTSRLSDMGTFVNKIRLSEIESLKMEERKGYLTLVLVTSRDSRLLLRKTEGIKDWQRSIDQQLVKERQRHREMQSTNEFWNRKQFSDCQTSAASQWLLVRDNIGHKYGYLSRMSPSNFHSETEDSGFESLVTVTSDSSSNSSRMVSPPPSQPSLMARHHQYERANYQHFNRK